MARIQKSKSKLSKAALLTLQKQLSALLERQKQLIRRKNELDNEIYKYETEYLESGQGYPLTNSLDFYMGQRHEKKKYVVQAKDRVFSALLPRIYR
ncbi:putative Histone H4 acetyltransferase, NuA4 complex, Eaf6 protein [Trachipleistophora hominis]|uniref:Chromatin modification-related protein EAF6 n=1 Tax=Trachipleistophora hominis TaxID=72359 RepID=L7JVC5_TRAHO|nr:putative Histone H4 acetyltransferase, NuA4 complex, Eaf6 protein [Trachipleistophora hominis]